VTEEYKTVIDQIHVICEKYPGEIIQKVALYFLQVDENDFIIEDFQASLIANIPKADLRAALVDLFYYWKMSRLKINPSSIGFALLTTSNLLVNYSEATKTDLVWTGPNTQIIPLRRTDQALLQVINSAKRDLLIVSFAVYKINFVVEALQKATLRDVNITIVLESEEESEGKLSIDGLDTIGKALNEQANFYVWPKKNRKKAPDGSRGVLHAKLALADSHFLFTTSANLTSHAMALNMELGVLIQGGELPKNVDRHFLKLIAERTLIPYRL
jgi:phosphatidylserine/phosphatidylglycerophosphate/cardiolipin synthase-like enzyme